MKPEDLIIGKKYLVFGQRKYYLGMTYALDTPQYLFHHSLDPSPNSVVCCLEAHNVESDVTDSEKLQYGVEYLITPRKKVNVCGQFSDRPFIGTFKARCGVALNFSVVCEDTDLDSRTFGSEFNYDFRIEEKDIKKIEKHSEGETMQVRKPEKIRLEIKPEELVKALNTLGYDLTGYELDAAYDLLVFDFVLKRGLEAK